MFSVRVKNVIRGEIEASKYCIVIDEAHDKSKREQMSIVLRFVDKNGCIQERFFGLVHVLDTTHLKLKNAIYSYLIHYNLDVQNIRGQGYDGASNMRGEFNGPQALILKDCKSAYYVHCFAHRLQLALVAAAKKFNMVGASCKRNDELKEVHADDIAYLISINELETGRGLNQIELRDDKWDDDLLEKVKAFCVARDIGVPDFSAQYVDRRGRTRLHQDSQIQEINVRFSEDAMKLLMLSSALISQNASDSLKYQDLCKLVEKFYPQDFTSEEKERLEMHLKHYEHNVVKGSYYKSLSPIFELCQWLVKTKKTATYDLVCRVIMLVLILPVPVSTATTER
ncbi:uncharacterized protein LOC142537793 [Primulina tabacum]|uniref:uncharacterized protein LOC142537793 n=1 Tax=Primulina tabacum TaxID=48773 RepID=UPI003F592A98